MAFGQASGRPATRSQLAELEELLQRAGYDGFRDARYPMNFTQRQAGGKFTTDEADEFIINLSETYGDDAMPPPDEAPPAPVSAARPKTTKMSKAEQALKKIPTEQLAAELQRRGWIVAEP